MDIGVAPEHPYPDVEPVTKVRRRGKRPTVPLDLLIGQRIRSVRRLRGQSQAVVAAQLGVSTQQLQKYETGKNRLSVSLMVQIARALQVSPSEFLEDADGTSSVDQGISLGDRYLLIETYCQLPTRELREQLLKFLRALSASQLRATAT